MQGELDDSMLSLCLLTIDLSIACLLASSPFGRLRLELKTPRTSLTKAQAVPLGYDAFLSFPASGKGYSGVGTYTSHSTVVPQKAEEGLTGLGLDPPHATLRPPLREHERIGAYPLLSEVDLFDSATSQGGAFDFVSLDLEGRAVLVDLGLFVLINVYCPNETNDDRLPYKVNFLRVLEARVQQLRKEKREVVVVGDINVVHRPEDHGEGTLASKQETFWNHPVRSGSHSQLPVQLLIERATDSHAKGPQVV